MKRFAAANRYHVKSKKTRRPPPAAGCTRLTATARHMRRRRPMIGEDLMAAQQETEHLREQLLRAQRLSSVGTLASSVAHEFNNILTTIINYAKLGLRPTADDQARTQALERILKGGQRAAGIVNSMLGYARNHGIERVPTDVARLVEESL